MTKLRHPVSHAAAVRRIIDAIGASAAAAAVGRSERLVHYWADPDHDATPQPRELVALDAAYIAAGHAAEPAAAPLAAWHLAELHRLCLAGGRPQSPLAHLAAVMREVGDVAREVEVAAGDGDLTPNERARICTEAREAVDKLSALIRDLAPEPAA